MENSNVLKVTTLIDENDGDRDLGTGLSLRDAIIIANSTPEDEIIELESEQIYQLTLEGTDPNNFDLILFPQERALLGDLDIAATGGKLTIRGLGEGATIDGNQINRIFQVHGDDDNPNNEVTLVLENITLTGGKAIAEDVTDTGGGAIMIGDRAIVGLIDCTITGNSANGGSGGAIFNRGSGLSVENCTIEDNLASDGGGIFSLSAVTEIIDSTITNNTVSFISTIGNTEIGSGGGVHHEGTGSTTITNTNITNNNAGFRGGGVFGEPSSGSRGSITITNSVVSGNTAQSGGGIGSSGLESLTIENTTIENNLASNNGGGIDGGTFAAIDEANLIDSKIRNNTATNNGGGINAAGTFRITNSVVSGNKAINGSGGGVNSILSTVVAYGSTFDNNTAGTVGGGLNSVEILINSTVSNNRAGGLGGGIFTLSPGIIGSSTISGNESDSSGGGLHIGGSTEGLHRVAIANSTISGNKARASGGGISIGASLRVDTPDENNTAPGVDYFYDVRNVAGDVYASNVTITNNIADSENDGQGNGGGVHISPSLITGSLDPTQGERNVFGSGKLTLINSILAGNFDTPNNQGQGTINPDIAGAARGNANNLVGDLEGLTLEEILVAPAAESLGQGSDIVNPNPRLGELQDNGGLTLTHALLTGSPAINTGDNENILRETFIDVDGNGELTTLNFDGNPDTTNAQLPYDQRFTGFSRIIDGTVDIGAFEFQEIDTQPPDSQPLLNTSIYRFQSKITPGTYLFAAEAERQRINQNFADSFTEEGLAFKVGVTPGDDLIPLYRFQSKITPGTYLFAAEAERQRINQNFADSFTEEGLAFYVYDADSGLGTDFSRFQNLDRPGTYLFATGAERDNILANFSNFVEEGIAFAVET